MIKNYFSDKLYKTRKYDIKNCLMDRVLQIFMHTFFDLINKKLSEIKNFIF